MAAATTRTNTEAITINIAKDPARWPGHLATLTPVNPGHGLPSVYLVTLNEEATTHYCPTMPAGTVLGGLTRVRSGWCVVAYTDRAEFLNGHGRGGWLPIDARNRAHGVRMLTTWWHIDNHPDYQVEKQENRLWRNA